MSVNNGGERRNISVDNGDKRGDISVDNGRRGFWSHNTSQSYSRNFRENVDSGWIGGYSSHTNQSMSHKPGNHGI